MKESTKSKILSGILAGTLMLSGCAEKSNCEVPSRHVHKYTKPITGEITIENYIDSEKMSVHGYDWNSDYIEINKYDEELYKLLNKNNLFDGITNWDYLYNKMYNDHDYLMFYYSYVTLEVTSSIDANGNASVSTRPVTHSGWHSDPDDLDNTGEVRLYHHRYYGYRVTRNNNEFYLEKSPSVDDIKTIIDEYPYYSEKCTEEVYKQYRFNRSELHNLRPEDFDVFNGPDLSSKEMILK